MSRRRSPSRDLEYQAQKELVRRLRLAEPRIWFFHPANERMLRSGPDNPAGYRTASRLRNLGLDTGVLDLIVESPTKLAPRGCRIEMKSPTGAVTPEQQEWREFYDSIGVPQGVFTQANAATDWLQNLGYWVEHNPPFLKGKRY